LETLLESLRQELKIPAYSAAIDPVHGGRRSLPYVFTEQGVAMLSSVLNSEHAIAVNIILNSRGEIFMKNYSLKIAIMVICGALSVMAFPPRNQSEQASNVITPKLNLRKVLPKHSGIPPVAQLYQNQTNEAAEREKRNERQRVSHGLYTGKVIVDPGMKEINGQAESINLTFVDSVQILKPGEAKDPPGLPISGATIVIGTIVNGDAYLNDEHTGVVSEYRVAVQDVLSSDPQNPLSVRDNISTWRPGGSVSFHSGHIKHFVVSGLGFPEIGTTYLLFLRPTNSSLKDYVISAAFSLKNQVVSALDDKQDQSSFDGTSENDFLNTVRKEIAARETGGRKQ
jgi:hypothetical protein